MYIDKLSVKLHESNVGCCFNNSVVNHLYYADDLCLLSPSVHGLRELLSVAERFAAANKITFNEAKSVCLYFKPKSGRINPNALFSLNNKCIKKERSCKYLGHIISDN